MGRMYAVVFGLSMALSPFVEALQFSLSDMIWSAVGLNIMVLGIYWKDVSRFMGIGGANDDLRN